MMDSLHSGSEAIHLSGLPKSATRDAASGTSAVSRCNNLFLSVQGDEAKISKMVHCTIYMRT